MYAHMLFTVLLTRFLRGVFLLMNREELLLQDPSLWPGHMEPFGTKQLISQIAEIDYWPEPKIFFKEYVDKSKPVLFKGLAKQSPGYSLFEDDFFKNAPGAGKTIVQAEPAKIENRKNKPLKISMKNFIERYHKESMYMVDKLPLQYSSQVLMPSPLRCESTKQMMVSQVTWFSSGGTKSVLHNDDVDNINCLFRGTKVLWMIEYHKNKKFVPLDRREGGYSSLNVEKVNYTQFPQMRNIDKYYKVQMEEGDCVFIPYFWFHQVNSVANNRGMNLAVNIWFNHIIGHSPEGCDILEKEATIDKYHFQDDDEEDISKQLSIGALASYFEQEKHVSFDSFHKMFIDDLIEEEGIDEVYDDKELNSLIKKVFTMIDTNEDGFWSEGDYDKISSYEDKKFWEFDHAISPLLANVVRYTEEWIVAFEKGTSLKESIKHSLPGKEKVEL